MFNNRRIQQLEKRIMEMQERISSQDAKNATRLNRIEQALISPKTFASFEYAEFIQVRSVENRIDRLMDHLGLKEQYNPESITIVKEKK